MIKPMKDYRFHSGIVLRAYYSSMQMSLIEKNDDAARYVYNKCVELDEEIYRLKQVSIYCKPIADRLAYLKTLRGSVKEISNQAPFLNEPGVDAQAKANAVQNHIKAWKQFREVPGTSKPTFHKKSYRKQYQTNPHYADKDKNGLFSGNARFIDEHHVQLPILGRVRVDGSPKQIAALFRMDTARIGTITVCIDECGDGWVSFQLAADEPFAAPFPKTGEMVGIDLNIENFYADSSGNIVDNPKYKKSSQDKLAKESWKLSRKITAAKREGRSIFDSKNLQKQRVKVAKVQRHIKRQRSDYQNVCSKDLVKSHDYIFAEDLKVKNMLKNHCLAYSISDVSWSEFQRQLKYKAERSGKVFLKVNARNTTQRCSCCGYVNEGEDHLTLDIREWDCPNCGEHHIRDVNSAINVLQRGMEALGLT